MSRPLRTTGEHTFAALWPRVRRMNRGPGQRCRRCRAQDFAAGRSTTSVAVTQAFVRDLAFGLAQTRSPRLVIVHRAQVMPLS